MKEKRDHSTIKMKYMKNLVYRLKISGKRLGKSIGRILIDALAVIGALVTIAEAASEIFQFQGFFVFYRKHVWWIAAAVIIGCVWKNWDRLKYTVIIADSSDITITLRVCDVLKNGGAVIIPTNSTFDTVMDEEFISVGSIQGQYQVKYFKGRLPVLDKKLNEGLRGKRGISLKDGRKYNDKRYPIGTVSCVSEKNRRAYFLADSDIDCYGHPIDVDAADVAQALTGLWNDLSKNGSNEPYSIPLIGTGKAKAKDASRNEVAQQIILSFLAASKEHKITENLTICIHPIDFDKIDWDGLCEFLKYQSQYANVKPIDSKQIGTAETTPKVIAYGDEQEIDENVEERSGYSSKGKKNSEHEQMLITLLTGNKLTRIEIAEALGLSIVGTNHLLKQLLDTGIINKEGPAKQTLYYVSDTMGHEN